MENLNPQRFAETNLLIWDRTLGLPLERSRRSLGLPATPNAIIEEDPIMWIGIAFLEKDSLFVVLVVLPESASKTHNTTGSGTTNGEILLFNVEHPIPIASRQREGVAFIQRSRSSRELVAYVNGDHEYVIFNPNSQEEEETYERKFKDTMEQGTDKIKKPKNKEVIPVKTERVEGISSEKQRVARTVVIGGLLNADMAEEVHSIARECGSVSSITYPLRKDETTYHGKDTWTDIKTKTKFRDMFVAPPTGSTVKSLRTGVMP
ncbi:unnamed protein product [Lactuca saligna]|uniref:RRM domain-containing protein n=1 Tax=Lactuca saligna TaxID=75948 RepID=A0AA36A1R9_LACSI|nr:unnamed protein product [Lactuca saligna]